MTRRKPRETPDIAADPYHERVSQGLQRRLHLLGGEFSFTSRSADLMEIVDWAYANLPRHQLSRSTPRLTLALRLGPRPRDIRADAPRIEMLSGASFLAATTRASDFVTLSPEQRAGLVVVSERMLRFRYHVRYELIEFAVFTLAARVQGLVPLHAACIGRDGRGLLIMGASGAGKSIASLLCLIRGLDFVTEDSAFVAPQSMMATGIANFLHVRREALKLVPDSFAKLIRGSPVIRRRSGVRKFELDLRRPEFRLAQRPLRIGGVVFVTDERARSDTLVATLGRAEALRRLRSSQPYAAHQSSWPLFSRRMNTTPAFVLRRGRHPTQTVDALEQLLSR